MCTVFALPLDEGGYVLAGNRDERLFRPQATPPSIWRQGARSWLAPRDPEGGGTWTSVNDLGLSLSLLNNYAAPMAEPAEVISRGQLVADLADSADLETVARRLRSPDWRLDRVRPFTLVAVVAGSGEQPAWARTMAWDGRQLQDEVTVLPAMWTSNGADQPLAERVREQAWQELVRGLVAGEQGAGALMLRAASDHRPEAGHVSICMHAAPVAATVSHTQISVASHMVSMRYLEGSPCRGELGSPLPLPRAAL